MQHLDRPTLEKGACHAVAHAFSLMEDASLLFARGRFSTCFHLSVLVREEHGRAKLLWKKSRSMLEGETIDAAALRRSLSNHVSKLDAGQSTTQFQLPPAFMTAWTSAIERNDTEALRELHKQRQAIVEAVRAKDPQLLHKRRLRAQYVDLNPDGSWSLPSETLRSDAQSLGLIVAYELSDFLRMEPDDQFAVAFAQSGESLPSDTDYDERVIRPLLIE